MSIQRWSQDVLLVNLPGEIEKHNELQTVIRMLRQDGDCDVVVDFSDAKVIGGLCLAGLLKIQRLVKERGHKLTLCGVAGATRGIFAVAHLDDLFEFADDRFTALASLQLVG